MARTRRNVDAPARTSPPRYSALAGLDALRELVALIASEPALATGPVPSGVDLLLNESHGSGSAGGGPRLDGGGTGFVDDPPDVPSLVARAQAGDADAFGALYDIYAAGVYRFCYHRTTSLPLAEDLTSETFFRALRSLSSFRWQDRDFGAWLTTIARNLVIDHRKSAKTRLEIVSDAPPERVEVSPGPEQQTLTRLTNEALAAALGELPDEQRDCLIMRFLQGLSIAETAEVLGRSEGAVKQLQLRAIRRLAKHLPEGVR
jgi:RNA polymerase sigma-70 factor, ECF subfamily